MAIALTKSGWKYVQLNKVTKMQKSWVWRNEEYRVDVYFGRLCNGNATPVVIQNVSLQGAGTHEVIDDNCDIWENIFTTTTVEEGNAYYKYLLKHGFVKVD